MLIILALQQVCEIYYSLKLFNWVNTDEDGLHLDNNFISKARD